MYESLLLIDKIKALNYYKILKKYIFYCYCSLSEISLVCWESRLSCVLQNLGYCGQSQAFISLAVWIINNQWFLKQCVWSEVPCSALANVVKRGKATGDKNYFTGDGSLRCSWRIAWSAQWLTQLCRKSWAPRLDTATALAAFSPCQTPSHPRLDAEKWRNRSAKDVSSGCR